MRNHSNNFVFLSSKWKLLSRPLVKISFPCHWENNDVMEYPYRKTPRFLCIGVLVLVQDSRHSYWDSFLTNSWKPFRYFSLTDKISIFSSILGLSILLYKSNKLSSVRFFCQIHFVGFIRFKDKKYNSIDLNC
jgi:hypothetical protein